jgi:hypothetical protein
LNLAAAASMAFEPSSIHETASEDISDKDEHSYDKDEHSYDKDEHSYDKPTLDEDPNDEVSQEDVLAQVKLAATIRKAVFNPFQADFT